MFLEDETCVHERRIVGSGYETCMACGLCRPYFYTDLSEECVTEGPAARLVIDEDECVRKKQFGKSKHDRHRYYLYRFVNLLPEMRVWEYDVMDRVLGHLITRYSMIPIAERPTPHSFMNAAFVLRQVGCEFRFVSDVNRVIVKTRTVLRKYQAFWPRFWADCVRTSAYLTANEAEFRGS